MNRRLPQKATGRKPIRQKCTASSDPYSLFELNSEWQSGCIPENAAKYKQMICGRKAVCVEM